MERLRKTCQFWVKAPKDECGPELDENGKNTYTVFRLHFEVHGRCHRYAPSPSFDKTTRKTSGKDLEPSYDYCEEPRDIYWPLTLTSHWCGDWKVFDFGQKTDEDLPLSTCEQDFNESGDLICDHVGMQFRMNKKTLRFLIINPIGYWSYGEKSMYGIEGTLQPFMEIGKCSKI